MTGMSVTIDLRIMSGRSWWVVLKTEVYKSMYLRPGVED